MKLSDLIFRAAGTDRNRVALGGTLLLGLLACALTANAQQVIATASPTISALGFSPFQWGPVTLHPHFFYSFVYGDGIQAHPGQQSTTAIHTLSPGILLNIGPRWILDYTPTQIYYSDPAFKDTLNHSVSLTGATTFEDWTYQFSQTFAATSTPLIETGQQTSEKDYATMVSGAYRFNNRVQLDTTLNQQSRFSDGTIPDVREWSIVERLHYRTSRYLDTALSVDLGYVDMSVGSDMTYTRPQAQITWQPSDKITLNILGGFENRKFRSGNTADLNSPTLSASIQYQPFETTTLSFTANRTVAVSYFQNQVTENTGWKVNLEQRLFQHFHLSTGLTQQKSSYVATSSSVAAGRDDRNYAFNVGLSTILFQRANIAISYQNSHNSSNDAGFGFSSNQIGFEVGYRF